MSATVWNRLDDSFPDSDQTVLLYDKDASEPVWLGYHDGLEWRYVDGFDANPTHWAEIPDPPTD